MGMRRLKGNLINLSLVILLSLSGWTGIRASELPKPASKVLLTITGNISRFNKDDSVELDLAMLEQFDQVSFVTETPWTDGPTRFTGVRINQLLEFVGARSNSFRASALDKYWNDLRDMDFEKVPAIIAYQLNDKPMRLRDLGPLWIMFPFDEYPELATEKYKTACVWQLTGIDVH